MKNWLIAVVGMALISWSVAWAEPMSLGDVKALAKAGVGDEVIISQIRNAQVSYHLTTTEIVGLKEAGVSSKVIDFMVNTTASAASSPQAATVQPISPAVGAASTPPPMGSASTAMPTGTVSTPPPVVSASMPTPPPVETVHPFGLADVKALAKAGMSDEVIISQIRNTRTIFHLSTAEIIDLKGAGVSNKVIDFLLNPPNMGSPAPGVPTGPVVAAPGQPPPPQVEVIGVCPGPDYMWVNGYWDWNGVRWVWIGGSWGHRHGDWGHGWRGRDGYWR